ncbi:MAG: alpha-glucosidase [Olsenella profusa]
MMTDTIPQPLTTERWWQRAVVYQIWPRSFQDSDGDGVGDLRGIIRRLPYLAWLGVDVLWLSPIYRSPMVDMGYDISDYQGIAPEFGTMADFDELLAQAHGLGLRVVMDLVVNHTSSEHPWFVAARSGRDNPLHDHYIWRAAVDGHEPSNLGSYFGGSAWEWDETCQQYYLHLFAKEQPDLNWDNPTVRDDVYAMMRWWLDKGVDGFRMDVISLISKGPTFEDGTPGPSGYAMDTIPSSGPHEHEYLREMRTRALAGHDTMCVGECPGVGMEEACRYANLDGSELDMIFQFEHTSLGDDATHGKWTCARPRLSELKQTVRRWQEGLEGRAWNSLFWGNHDQPRAVSRWGSDSDEWRETSAKMLACCLMLMKGTPYIFQGDELGMCNYPFACIDDFRDLESKDAWRMLREDCGEGDEEALAALRARSRDNARTPMQWDAGHEAGFTCGTPWMPVNPNYPSVNMEEERGRTDSVLAFYRMLIALRHASDLIVHGTFRMLDPTNEESLTYERVLDKQGLLVACNFCAHGTTVGLPVAYRDDSALLLSNYPDGPTGKCADGRLALRPYESIVVARAMTYGELEAVCTAAGDPKG